METADITHGQTVALTDFTAKVDEHGLRPHDVAVRGIQALVVLAQLQLSVLDDGGQSQQDVDDAIAEAVADFESLRALRGDSGNGITVKGVAALIALARLQIQQAYDVVNA